MNQLEKDLRRQVRRKLELWVQDSFDLYDMAEVDTLSAGASVLEALMKISTTMVAGMTTMSPNEVGQIFRNMVEQKRRDIAQQEAESKSRRS